MKKLNLFSATAIGVGSIIGSGWLFAAYYAAKFAGPISILSWIIGAAIALAVALLLAEIATIYQETGLFSRLLTITHNRDYGFLIAAANWFSMIVIIPSEAVATVQYLATSVPSIKHYIFYNETLTGIGIAFVCLLIVVYGLLNYWGARLLAHSNNIITTIKLLIPLAIGIIIIWVGFHPSNFIAYKNTIAPYGISNAFKAVVSCGIFYAFYGFSMITVFAKELENPQRNIPLALVASVVLCLIIYLVLQVAFIGAIPPDLVANGWHNLNYSSPLVDLSILLGLNWLAIVLYATATLSPSGSGIVYTGSGARMLNGMALDHQMPKVFAKLHPKFFISRTSLVFTILLSMILITFFDNWQKIVVIVTVFQIISCIAVPIAFSKLRQSEPNTVRTFRLPFGKTISLITYVALTYLLIQSGFSALILSLFTFLILFLMYGFSYYKSNMTHIIRAFMSAWSLFAYLAFIAGFGWFHDKGTLNAPIVLSTFIVISVIFFWLLIRQKAYNK